MFLQFYLLLKFGGICCALSSSIAAGRVSMGVLLAFEAALTEAFIHDTLVRILYRLVVFCLIEEGCLPNGVAIDMSGYILGILMMLLIDNINVHVLR